MPTWHQFFILYSPKQRNHIALMFEKKINFQNQLGHLYRDTETIIKQGTSGDCLFLILQGKVNILRENSGQHVKIAELGKGELFGEMALLERDVRSCSVKSHGNSKVLTLDKKQFLMNIKNDPAIAFRLLEKLSNRLRKTITRLEHLELKK